MCQSGIAANASSKYAAISSAPVQVLSGKRTTVSAVHTCLSTEVSR